MQKFIKCKLHSS